MGGVAVAAVVVGVAGGAGDVSRGCDDRGGREPGRNEGQRGQTAENGDDDSVYENPPWQLTASHGGGESSMHAEHEEDFPLACAIARN
jgi:hypothetical protein